MIPMETRRKQRISAERARALFPDDTQLEIDLVLKASAEHAAVLEARLARLTEVLRDCASGLQYIRYSYGELYGVGWDRALDAAHAALAEQPKDGRVLAPKEPTEAMMRAGNHAGVSVDDIYRAMLDAREELP